MDEQKPELEKKLHVVVFPWLAIGHLIPFFHLCISLARKGVQISFVSTPNNLQKIPKIPQNLSSLITLVSLPLNHDQNLPESAESSNDIPIEKTQYLKKAFDGLELPLTNYLINSKPDYIIHDYASYWVPKISGNLGIPCVFFAVFTGSFMGFIGPPEVLLDEERDRNLKPEDFTTTPKWITFPTDIVYRTHELLEYFKGAPPQDDQTHDVDDLENDGYKAVPDTRRFGMVIRDSNFIAIRSSPEFESDWLSLLHQLYQKPVIPLGFLPPPLVEDKEESNNWVEIKTWLDKQKQGSVIYVALGTEAALSQEQVNELAIGLESTGLPFFWVLRKPLNNSEQSLPLGFEDRTSGRGLVYMKWAPQVKILGHPSIGGFLTHCGYNSVIEGLAFGRVLVLLPMLNDQGLNSRLLDGKKAGIEVHRNERDGSFSSESLAEAVKIAMAGDEGQVLRNNAKEMIEIFGNEKLNVSYVNDFVQFLKKHKN
ncbi:UDP-glycosyltransferase 91C1-like [Papaver somniferum]|uniref:UDP-glycosyltransferase 91C1-like n=1 Tax=Papaver somniferum TaxID=3469 RepID=UPI000E702820|nr:UDP-glycosyltransferase 91C1-like [Papaver somniferum]